MVSRVTMPVTGACTIQELRYEELGISVSAYSQVLSRPGNQVDAPCKTFLQIEPPRIYGVCKRCLLSRDDNCPLRFT